MRHRALGEMAGGPIGTFPCGPTTWVNVEVGSTSTSTSHGSMSSANASTLATIASMNPAGSRRPTPATNHTSVPQLRAAAAIVDEPTGTTARPGSTAIASTSTTSACFATTPATPASTGSTSTSYRSSRRTNDVAVCPASSANTLMSPRRINPSPITSGSPIVTTSASSGNAAPNSAPVGSLRISSASSHTASKGSADVDTLAHNHHIAPVNGCRSTIRRHATTRPDGSKWSDPSA